MACLDAASFQKLMYDRETAIHEEILESFSKLDDVWNKDVIIPNTEWMDGEGYIREKVRHHGGPNPQLEHSELWTNVEASHDDNEVPVGDEDYDEDLVHSNCDLGTCQDIEIGIENFTYRPKYSCLKGPKICAEDIRHGWKFQQLMDLHTRVYMEAVASHKSRWNRDIYTSLSRRFPALIGYQDLTHAVGTLPVVPPTIELLPMSIGLLDQQYPMLSIEASRWATGRTAMGAPSWTVIMPPEDITALMRDTLGEDAFLHQGNAVFREAVMEGLGTTFQFGNWTFKADQFGNRFKRNATTGAFERVTPWSSTSANITGKKWRVSRDYINAPYAEAVILMKDVFKNQVYKPLSTVGGGSRLGSADNGLISWDGAPIWTYVPSECDPYGLSGNYRFHFKRAPEPLACDLSYTIIYKRCPFAKVQTVCTTGAGCDDRVACAAPTTVWACTVSGSTLVLVASQAQDLAVGNTVTVNRTGTTALTGGTVSAVDTSTGLFKYTVTFGSTPACGASGVSSVVKT